MKHKLSTDAALPEGELKKGEAKKRKSPLTPYREKAKGKETNPVLVAQVYRARTRGVALKRLVSAAVEDALREFNGKRGPAPSDEALWANFAWRFGVEKFRDLCHQAKRELDAHREPIAASARPSVLQSVLSPFWSARFGKGGR